MMKRIALFVITNLLVVFTISLALNLLGVRPYLTASGIDYSALLMFCGVWGMGGAFISLAISRWMAKMSMGVQVIDPNNPGQFAGLLNTVHDLAKRANLPAMPEVGIYESPEVNAFATGPTKSRSLVAVSTGLLRQMDRNEVEGVLGHEIAHIANGDMVTMTLLQGVVNAFVMFFARAIGFLVSQNVKEESRAMVQMLTVIVLDILLGLLGVIVVCWFSRQREFRADAGSAQISGRANMIAALKRLQPLVEQHAPGAGNALATMKISGRPGLLFASHPPLSERIARLEAGV